MQKRNPELVANLTPEFHRKTADGELATNSVFVRFVKILPMTTTERNALVSPADGTVIYNSTDAKFQGRAGGAWVNFH